MPIMTAGNESKLRTILIINVYDGQRIVITRVNTKQRQNNTSKGSTLITCVE